MKVSTFFLLVLFTATPACATEELSADFLEFLVEMQDVTGNGFENWINSDSVDSDQKQETEKQQDE